MVELQGIHALVIDDDQRAQLPSVGARVLGRDRHR